MGESQEPRRVYSPGDVAQRLGVSGQRLRQLAGAYERVRGPLPRDERGRVWPEDAVDELERARDLVRDGRAGGIEAALRGELTPGGVTPYPPPRGGAPSDIAALAGELRGLREALEEQNRLLRDQSNRLERLEQAALPAAGTPGTLPGLREAPETASEPGRGVDDAPKSAGEGQGEPERAAQRPSAWQRLAGWFGFGEHR